MSDSSAVDLRGLPFACSCCISGWAAQRSLAELHPISSASITAPAPLESPRVLLCHVLHERGFPFVSTLHLW